MKTTCRTLLLIAVILLCGMAALAAGNETLTDGGRLARLTAQAGNAPRYTKVIHTEFFDIIYPEESERTAFILAEQADDLYRKAASLFETETWMHIPVIISPVTQNINAYYSSTPYNHIVVLDTPNDVTQLAVFSETVINIFYHELIHAVTLSIGKNRTSPPLLGDVYTMQNIFNSKLFMDEGATVSMESRDGEGRLNSGDTMAYLVQAALEDKFPSWKDIAGPRDIFPAHTASYIFGGAFSGWLQETYGQSAYANFWKEMSGFNLLGFSGAFRKAYGISIYDAWAAFSKTVPVPETEDSALLTELSGPAVYGTLAVRQGDQTGLAYVRNNSQVCYRQRFPDGTYGGETLLFNCGSSPAQLSFSEDGRYLVVSGIMTQSSERYSVRIFDMWNSCFAGAEIPLARNGVIVRDAAGSAFLMCVETAGNYEFMTSYSLEEVLSGTDVPDPVSCTELRIYDEIYSSTVIPGGTAYLRKTDGRWYLTVAMLSGENVSFAFPDNMVPAGLSAAVSCHDGTLKLYTAVTGKGLLAGSATEPGSLSRLAEIRLSGSEATLSFQKKAFSGGVHGVQVLADGTVFSIARKAEWYVLDEWNLATSSFTAPEKLQNVQLPAPAASVSANTSVSAFTPEDYNQFSYMGRGTLFPLSFVPLSSLNVLADNPGLGVTWWTANPQGTLNLVLSADMTDPSGSLGLYTGVFGEYKSLAAGSLDWNADVLATVSDSGLQDISASFGVLKKLPLSDTRQVIGIRNISLAAWSSSTGPQFADVFVTQYSRSVKKGMNPLSVTGFTAGTSFSLYYLMPTTESNIIYSVKNRRAEYDETLLAYPGLYVKLNLARLLPLPYDPEFVYNLPLAVEASLCNSPKEMLSFSAETTLFSAEIQKGIPYVPFYCNRFIMTAGYSFTDGCPTGSQFLSCHLFNTVPVYSRWNEYRAAKNLYNVQAVTGSMNFVLSPDIAHMYSISFNLGIDAALYLQNDYSDKKYDITLMGIFKW